MAAALVMSTADLHSSSASRALSVATSRVFVGRFPVTVEHLQHLYNTAGALRSFQTGLHRCIAHQARQALISSGPHLGHGAGLGCKSGPPVRLPIRKRDTHKVDEVGRRGGAQRQVLRGRLLQGRRQRCKRRVV